MFVVSKNRRKHHYSYGCFEKRYQEDGNTVLEAWIDADFTTHRNGSSNYWSVRGIECLEKFITDWRNINWDGTHNIVVSSH